MNKQGIFAAWTPDGATWSPWVKPVLFAQMDSHPINLDAPAEAPAEIRCPLNFDNQTAIVADLPGALATNLAPRLAAVGFQPIPLYNACPAPAGDSPVVRILPIMAALAAAAPSLAETALPNNAPPAFLLDANRNPGGALPGQFDNRSISLPTDFPSANLLLANKIRRVVLIQAAHTPPQADLSHTLRRWQEAGVPIFSLAINQPETPQPITVERPKLFKLLWYTVLAKLGLKANPLGGFGGLLPMPSTG